MMKVFNHSCHAGLIDCLIWLAYGQNMQIRQIFGISDGKLILCGDLNSNTQWDEWDRWWNHSDVVRELADINIHSLYHKFTGEAQGKESTPTLFMHRKLEKPYHIDYAFISKNLSGQSHIEIGTPDTWLEFSDHMPVIFKISI